MTNGEASYQTETTLDSAYDVIVVGAGHAGCEAALAAARMGRRTLVLTGNPDTVALMPCNPSIGGPAKGHVVREIDAIGGEMGRAIDRSFIQIRLLNTGKGPAVQALRAQADKDLYSRLMRRTLEGTSNLTVGRALVRAVEPLAGDPEARGAVVTDDGRQIRAGAVVVTTGTFLSGRLICGEQITPGGRAGEPPAQGLSACLRGLGFRLGRLKTGTPPRVHAAGIDYAKTVLQPGSPTPLHFAFAPSDEGGSYFSGPPNPRYPHPDLAGWRPQLPCYLVHTNERTHAAIRANLHRAPMFTGVIEGVGPRYCPSIEDKIVRFADKVSHGLFLEPEGWLTDSVYVQGANTSLPEDVQDDLIRSIPALADAEILRYGYAVEYDFVLPSQTYRTLESKLVPGLYFAGQINGTSGYEEAAGQGLIAGINAALRAGRRTGDVVVDAITRRLSTVDGGPPSAVRPGCESLADALDSIRATGQLVLPRGLAYIGVMIDDLTTSSLTEPYRLFTSRAEYRLLLRQDNADLRLTPIGYALGLIDEDRFVAVERKRAAIATARRALARRRIAPTPANNAA
ncbi:MAG TPA: tRNA uridine-5-carboxymethylaminomethyl(34) synthesis enzyme MnmG, partial [Dehalococcoidia bacterium]|nr:tRNA uridine-5-carboxymethylaminomethyl(34) synthesis enzyme MnmG [Dehalococcoidia bacterium]